MTLQVEGAPNEELVRSPAAAAVSRMAVEAQLLMAHFEYRVPLEVPEHWLPAERPDLGRPGEWLQGSLTENKYTSFRSDMLIASFHPGHRAKWTTHELCHGLIGFAWKPGATPFFHALAARLSELLPVALYYFFDEVQLRRCSEHQGGGPLFAVHCPACELAARSGPDPQAAHAERFSAEGKAFVARELDAIARSRSLARPVSSPWANLDLCSDGLAYAASQSLRLASPEFARYMELFFPSGCGRHESLEALEARVREVMGGICDGTDVTTLGDGRWRWVAQDLGWRLLKIAALSDRELAVCLDPLIEGLAADPSETTVRRLMLDYQALHEEFVTVEPDELFSVGYALPGRSGRSVRQIGEGIASACPTSWDCLGQQGEAQRTDLVELFSKSDISERRPLGLRFSDWLTQTQAGDAAQIAIVEAAVAHAPRADATTLTLGVGHGSSDRLRLDPAVRILRTSPKVSYALGLVEELEASDEPIWLAIRRDVAGDVAMLQLSDDLGSALAKLEKGPIARDALGLDHDLLGVLERANLVAPTGWLA